MPNRLRQFLAVGSILLGVGSQAKASDIEPGTKIAINKGDGTIYGCETLQDNRVRSIWTNIVPHALEVTDVTGTENEFTGQYFLMDLERARSYVIPLTSDNLTSGDTGAWEKAHYAQMVIKLCQKKIQELHN